MEKMPTMKLVLVIGECLNEAFEAINENDVIQAELILDFILRRWLKERPLTLHTEN